MFNIVLRAVPRAAAGVLVMNDDEIHYEEEYHEWVASDINISLIDGDQHITYHHTSSHDITTLIH